MAYNPSVVPPHVVVHGAGAQPTQARAVKCARCGSYTPKPVTQPNADATFSCGHCRAKLSW